MFKKYLGAASVLLAIASLGLLPAHAADSTDAKNAALVAQLTKLSDDWDAAIVRKDKAAIEANMAEDFRQIDGDGDLETKTSFVNGLVSDKLTIDPYKVEDFEIRLYGNVALLSGRTKMTGHYDGKPFKSHYRYIDIYAQRDGKWQIVSVQISRIPQQ
ncbi:nuclear transport factor 2 family protein [Undibacterium sp. TC4M20W]|uniref:nuclear transport factor 2 family protein n=1 Tax=Undibacterium sp. TC4M20W TaxID=3413052 RepID=UPI003BF0FCE4